MATPLDLVVDILDTLKSDEVVIANPIKYARLGVVKAGISLGVKYPITSTKIDVVGDDGDTTQQTVYQIEADLDDEHVYLCGLCSYRAFAVAEHDKYSKKAVNFKTLAFAVSGLTERAKELMKIVSWCDKEIKLVLDSMSEPNGHCQVMKGDE